MRFKRVHLCYLPIIFTSPYTSFLLSFTYSHTDMYTAANIAALFIELSDLPFTNESEARLNNTTKAEVFAGLLRAYRGHASVHGTDTGTLLCCFLLVSMFICEMLAIIQLPVDF